MKLFYGDDDYKLYHSDMNNILEDIELNSVDSIVTDPPYELNFMGKSWDNQGVAFRKETWQKCFDVLKPGGYLLAFGGSRTFHRIACAIEDAGFEIRDTIMWLYGSGFPKSMDISKQIDKRGGESVGWFGDYLKGILEERGMTQSDLSKHFPSKNGNQTGRVSNWIKGVELPTNEQFNKVCELLKLPLTRLCEAEREVIGRRKSGLTNGSIANFSGENEFDVTAPSTDLAKQWSGWGTCLKPAFEPIIVARKPFNGSLVDNIIEYGVGGLNIDECRVAFEDTPNPATNPLYRLQNGYKTTANCGIGDSIVHFGTSKNETSPLGRFPANTILTYDETDEEEVCGGFPNTKSGVRNPSGGTILDPNKGWNNNSMIDKTIRGFEDSGSASRYFYCAKASKKDRDDGLNYFQEKSTGYLQGGRKEGSAGSIMKNADGGTRVNPYAGTGAPKKNIHPTVKPTELMQYLIRLVTPNGGTVLDPFNGSGSTGKAVMFENKEKNKGYKYIGVELDENYLKISKARIDYARGTQVMDWSFKPTEKKEETKNGKYQSLW